MVLLSVAALVCGYIFYGGWPCKQWGVGESKEETPVHTLEDGVDYVPAKAPVLMGHHFSSIAAGGADWGPYAQVILAVLLIILAVMLVIEGIQTLFGKNKKAEKTA